MPPVRVHRLSVRSARPWLISRLNNLKHLAHSIQDSKSSEVFDGVFTVTEIAMIEGVCDNAIERLSRGNYKDD